MEFVDEKVLEFVNEFQHLKKRSEIGFVFTDYAKLLEENYKRINNPKFRILKPIYYKDEQYCRDVIPQLFEEQEAFSIQVIKCLGYLPIEMVFNQKKFVIFTMNYIIAALQLMIQSGAEYTCILVGLISKEGNVVQRHMNCLFIDFKNKLIERFEPNGSQFKKINDKEAFYQLVIHLSEKLKIDFNYTELSAECPKLNFKTKKRPGYCDVISMMIFHFKMIYPEIRMVDIKKAFSRLEKVEFIILKYANYLHKLKS